MRPKPKKFRNTEIFTIPSGDLNPKVARWLYNRVMKQNKNVILAIIGKTGSGKTYSGIRLMELLAKMTGNEFNADYITFYPQEFMKMLNSGRMKQGSAIQLDEAGVVINAKKWQSSINQLIGSICQTVRHKNYVFLFVLPHLGFLDKTVRCLLHGKLKTKGVDRERKVCKTVLSLMDTDDYGNIEYSKLRYRKDGKIKNLAQVNFGLANSKILDEYEKRKTAFTSRLMKEAEVDMNSRPKLSEMQAKCLHLRKGYGMETEEISEILGITPSTIKSHLSFCKKKGYSNKKGERKEYDRGVLMAEIEELGGT